MQSRRYTRNLEGVIISAGTGTFPEERQAMALDPEKLNALMGKALVDFGATMHAGLVVIGKKLGLYKALAAETPFNLVFEAKP